MATNPDPNPISDDDLARRACAEGCGASMEALTQRMRPRLVMVLRRRLGHAEDAEDVAQAALMRLFEQREKYDPRRPFGPWLFTIAYRLATDHQRRRRETRGESEAAWDRGDSRPGPSDEAAMREERGRVWGIAERVLDERSWTALWLAYGEGMTPSEVGGVMGVKAGHARVLLHRARAALVPHLAEEDPRASVARGDARAGPVKEQQTPHRLRLQT